MAVPFLRRCRAPRRPARLAAPAAFAAWTLVAASALAADLQVQVLDADGTPVPGAVVMVEPAQGRLPVKPMTGVEVGQQRKQFVPQVTVVTVGTPVMFPNFDTVRHHVYSFSPTRPFELKLYAGVPSAPVVFDKPGIAVIGCNIHDRMAAWIVVADTPHVARSDADGRARVTGLGRGAFRLKVWHPSLPTETAPPSQPITVGADDLEQSVRLPTSVATTR